VSARLFRRRASHSTEGKPRRFDHDICAMCACVGAVWNDFGDALYMFSAGLASSVAGQIELKIELLDAFKTKPPTDLVKKNDVALLTAIVYKF
jgi:hypothetical protein